MNIPRRSPVFAAVPLLVAALWFAQRTHSKPNPKPVSPVAATPPVTSPKGGIYGALLAQTNVNGKTRTVPLREAGWQILVLRNEIARYDFAGQTDAQGHFKINLPPDTYRMKIAPDNANSRYQCAESDSGALGWTNVAANYHTRSDISAKLKLIPTGGVYGHIALTPQLRRQIEKNAGEPLNDVLNMSNWCVRAKQLGDYSEPADAVSTWLLDTDATLDAQGNFKLALPPGDYILEIWSLVGQNYVLNPQSEKAWRTSRRYFSRADLTLDPKILKVEIQHDPSEPFPS